MSPGRPGKHLVAPLPAARIRHANNRPQVPFAYRGRNPLPIDGIGMEVL
jgi:hypothetical protein